MAFDIQYIQNLSGSGKGIKVFTYSTDDNKATVKGANYFDTAADLLAVGDRIEIHASDADFDAHVSAISSGAVTIAAIDSFA